MATSAKRNRRGGGDRRATPDRRNTSRQVGNDRRAGVDRRSGADRRRNRGFDPLVRLQASVLLGAVLAIPAVGTWMDGAIPVDTMMVRIAIGMVFAVIAVNGINALIVAYTPAPTVDQRGDGVEDAELVEGRGDLAGESPL